MGCVRECEVCECVMVPSVGMLVCGFTGCVVVGLFVKWYKARCSGVCDVHVCDAVFGGCESVYIALYDCDCNSGVV